MKKSEVLKKDKRLISPSYTRIYDLVVDRAKGVYIFDVEKKAYLDFTSGIAVANAGYNNPDIVKAIKKQAEKITHIPGTDFYSELMIEVAKRLVNITPGKFEKRVFLANSGAESIECALKLMRWYTKKPRIISFLGAFHGRTYGSMSLSASKLVHRDHFGPLVPSITHTPYAYCYRCPFYRETDNCDLECLDYLEDDILAKVVPSDEVAGVIIEPIQGENGYIVPPKKFHKRLQKICQQRDFLLVCDEIQTGFGRSGKFFASEIFGIKPDIICVAKAISSGLPMGACIARKNIMSWPKGSHASTFSGSPVPCASAIATIDYIKKYKLWQNADKLGKFGLKYLTDLMDEIELIGDVRGLGLMIGVELVRDRKTKEPAKREMEYVLNKAFKRRLLLLPGGESTVRIAPPLIITKEEFQEGLETMAEVLKIIK